jgi:oxygen-independent coproporphyrinogen-3 oxidase
MNINEINLSDKNKNSKKELMLYIHIPFCEKKCDYCDFLSAPASGEMKVKYVDKLIQEIKSHKEKKEEYKVTSIFIGGGTPSSLPIGYISRIMEAVAETFYPLQNTDDMEVTIEANPGTVNKDKLLEYKLSGINRISFGLQSTDNKELKELGRIHTYEIFLENYRLAREVGFKNINIDLMSGLPGQRVNDWLATLENIIALNPEHISAYSLIIEEGTPFYSRYGLDYNNEETDRIIYTKTKEVLQENGYNRYEISNYAKENCECEHNIGYWRRKEYLGLGLGASSLLKGVRLKNEEDINNYLALDPDYNGVIIESSPLSKKEEMEEFMFLGLRLTKGISKSNFLKQFSQPIEGFYNKELIKSEQEDLLYIGEDDIYLTEKGIDLSNIVMSRFLLDD